MQDPIQAPGRVSFMDGLTPPPRFWELTSSSGARTSSIRDKSTSSRAPPLDPARRVNQNGDFAFNDTGNPNTTGLSIANAALGNFDTYSEFGTKAYTPYVATSLDLFAQDSWKATTRLTVEYGERWSI